MKTEYTLKSPNRFIIAQRKLEELEALGEKTLKHSKLVNFKKKLYPISKRGIDIFVSSILLFILSPLFILCAILIKLQDRGPILYISKRVGLKGKLFLFPKFRTMSLNAEKNKLKLQNTNQHGKNGITFKMKSDPRITPMGKWMRRFSIDELPQLFCVFIGSMSLVGPRPPIPSEVSQYTLRDRHRLDAQPGITCIWQVSGRAEIPFPIQMKMDLEYVRKRNLKLDCLLLLKTIPAVIFGKGAY